MKKKYILSVLGLGIIALLVLLKIDTYKNPAIDRFNPVLKKTFGYAILPEKVTYNNGKEYDSLISANKDAYQFPDDYNVFVVDSPSGDSVHRLKFSGGQSPKGKNFARVKHKGMYVYSIEFIKMNEIPVNIQVQLTSIESEKK